MWRLALAGDANPDAPDITVGRLAADGATVGVLDADIYGPSQPMMLGITGRPESKDGKALEPMEGHGLQAMSIGFLIDTGRNGNGSDGQWCNPPSRALGRASALAERVTGEPGWAVLPAALASASLIVAGLGLYWDVALHIAQGRDAGPLANPSHYLILAGLFEIGWAIGLKYTEGFTRLWPTVGTAVALAASMGLLGVALRTLNGRHLDAGASRGDLARRRAGSRALRDASEHRLFLFAG